jgi:hypothetical protein
LRLKTLLADRKQCFHEAATAVGGGGDNMTMMMTKEMVVEREEAMVIRWSLQ